MNRYCILLGIAIIASGCSSSGEIRKPSACSITPPEKTQLNVEALTSVQTELEIFSKKKLVANSNSEFQSRAEETYQKLADKDVACSMLLRTIACLSENGSKEHQILEFQEFLKETKSCEWNEQAILTIDNVVQVFTGEAIRFKTSPVQVDLFVRNAGDKPAMINSVIATFDNHKRLSRGPQSAEPLTSIYAVTVDSLGATVKGAELNSPAKAFYQGVDPVLIISTPIAQTLGPRSTDRFRIKYVFMENFEARGEREKLDLTIKFNKDQIIKSETLDIVQENSCFESHVHKEGKQVIKNFCR